MRKSRDVRFIDTSFCTEIVIGYIANSYVASVLAQSLLPLFSEQVAPGVYFCWCREVTSLRITLYEWL